MDQEISPSDALETPIDTLIRALGNAASTPEADKDREWRAGFEAMGSDPDTNDVDYLLPAAREVVFSD